MEFILKKNTPTQKFHKHWQFCVGSGHAGMAMRTDYCRQLKRVHEELGIQRVRFHGIFCDDMHTWDTMDVLADTSASPVPIPYHENSFRLAGLVYDNILECGMKPFVELSFMPKALAKTDKRGGFFYKPNIAMPRDDAQWQGYIRKFIRFLLDRYGKEEVETWYFEVWNEPDLPLAFFYGTQQDYFHLYEITVRAIKEVDDKLMVGGPATSNSKWVEAFVAFCEEKGVPADFITTHQYAGDPISGASDQSGLETEADLVQLEEDDRKKYAPQGDISQLFQGLPTEDALLPVFRRILQDNTETDDLNRDILPQNAAVVREQAKGRPVFYTEWNTCATFTAPGNDTRKVAAYDVRTILAAEAVLEGSSIWCFSDIFEELHPFQEEFHGGFGIQTQHGIPKPVYHALKMLADAGDERYVLPGALDGEVSFAAFQKGGDIQLLLTRQNLKHFANADTEPAVVTLRVELEKAPQVVQLQRIDEDHCNPLQVWEEMGAPIDITPSQKQVIIEESALATEMLPVNYENGILTIEAALGINDVYFFTIHTA
ncbi:hypothetical protein LJC60_08260 [Ruminococcaceae bacterium OttesenSCG-928-D13]|nr:hypothetical protein [Ruminococcaceae bacterium OttesenSCG-928-D13]